MMIDLYIIKLSLLCSLLKFVNSYCDNHINCFHKSLFKFDYPPVGFYELQSITKSGINKYNDLNVIGYGDLDGDLSTDFITKNISSSNSSKIDLHIYLWSSNQQSYILSAFIKNQECLTQNIYLYDVNSDGLLDITIFGKLIQSENYENCLIPYFRRNQAQLYFDAGSMLNFSTSSQPTLFSYGTGMGRNMISGLLFYSTNNKTRSYAVYQHGVLNQYVMNQWNSIFIQNESFKSIAFRDPHWNSYLDITGDCQSDLVLINNSSQIQIWVNNGSKFYFDKKINIGKFTSLSFSDINYDGTPDMVVGFSNRIQILYNSKQIQDAQDFCCSQCKSFTLNQKVKTTITFPKGSQMSEQILHISDIDINGYPDILLYLTNQTKNSENNYPLIYLNSNGQEFSANTEQYAFNIYIKQNKTQWLQGSIVSVSYLDILQNGILDILIVVETEQEEYRLYSFYNNRLQQNSFFIKGFGASGDNSSSGCQLVGNSFYWVNSIGNSKRCAFQSQIIQTAYNALQLTYAYSGLGRANNYVESFTLGVYGLSRSWSPIIPNSQLAVYASSSDQNEWGIRVFVLPTDSLAYVIIVSIVILMIMGCILLAMKYHNHKKKEQPLMMDFIN